MDPERNYPESALTNKILDSKISYGMDRHKLLKHLVVLMFFIFLGQTIGERLHLHYSTVYFDIIMHFLGGLWVGLFFIYAFYHKSGPNFSLNLRLKVALATLIVGLLWEFYEYFLNMVSITSFDLPDTILDLSMDIVGSISAILFTQWQAKQR